MWTDNILKTKLFENDDRVFLKQKSKMTGDRFAFKFLRRSVDGKHLMRFQSEKKKKTVFNFLRQCGQGLSETRPKITHSRVFRAFTSNAAVGK